MVSYDAGSREAMHIHDTQAQLKWPREVAIVRTPRGVFVLPPNLAVWIPPGERHGGIYVKPVREHSLFVDETCCEGLPTVCCAVAISPRLEQTFATLFAHRGEERTKKREEDQAALAILREELADTCIQPLLMTLPSASRVQLVIDMLVQNPALDRPLLEWAKLLGMSPSSFSRAFHREAGLSFGSWRTRARLLHALQRLALGTEVAQVARELGYLPSAFVQMFRKVLGATPGQYFAGRRLSR